MTKNKSRKALSLIELMVTVGVISVLLCMGLMSFDQVSSLQKANSGASQLADAINKTRSYAKRNGVKTSISTTVGSSIYSIKDSDGTIITDSSRYDSLSGQLPDGIKIFSSSCGTINFYIDGSVLDSNDNRVTQNCVISVGASSMTLKTITLKALSGEVDYD